jgi:hypothetical protein
MATETFSLLVVIGGLAGACASGSLVPLLVVGLAFVTFWGVFLGARG